MLVKEVGEKGLSPVINFIYTGELELGDLSWAGTDYTDLLTLQLMKFDLKGEMIVDNIWARGEIQIQPGLQEGVEEGSQLQLVPHRTGQRGLYANQIIQLRQK